MNGSDRFEGDYLSAEYAAAYTQAPLDYTFDHSGTPSPPPPQSPGGGGDIYPPFQFPVLSSPPPFAHFPVPASILHPTLRTVYLGNLSRDTTVEDILNHVRHGAIESCKILEDKNCAFVTFLDPTAASMFHQEAVARRLQIHGNELKVGWGKPTSPPPPSLIMAIQNGATRVVFVGGVDADVTNESLREEFSRFGTVDTVRVLTEKRIAFIHMASISMAVKAVATLQAEDRWQGKRINFAKDRCLPGSLKGSYVPGMMGQLGMMGLPGVPMGMLNPPYGMPMPPYDTFYNGPPQNGHPPPGELIGKLLFSPPLILAIANQECSGQAACPTVRFTSAEFMMAPPSKSFVMWVISDRIKLWLRNNDGPDCSTFAEASSKMSSTCRTRESLLSHSLIQMVP